MRGRNESGCRHGDRLLHQRQPDDMVGGQELAGGRGRIDQLSPPLRFKCGDHAPNGRAATRQSERLGPQAQRVQLWDGPVRGQSSFGNCQQPHGQQAQEPAQVRVRRLDLDTLVRILLLLARFPARRIRNFRRRARGALQRQVDRAIFRVQGDRLDAEPVRSPGEADPAPTAWPTRHAPAMCPRPPRFPSHAAEPGARAGLQGPRRRGATLDEPHRTAVVPSARGPASTIASCSVRS